MQEKMTYTWKHLTLLMLIAYAFSFAIRMIWVAQFHDNPSFHWMDELMINTNDGYFFASMAQKILEDMHQYNPRVFDGWNYAVVAVTVLATKLTPFSLETVILYMPAIISGLVVIPIILIGKLYKNLPLGFLAALIGSVAWSYYNRTMIGYYDTDMFSAMAPMFILYFLLATIETEKRIYPLLAALSILIYPFLYDAGLSLVYAMGLFYMAYMVVFHKKENFTYQSITLISIALMGTFWYIKLPLILAGYFFFKLDKLEQKKLIILSVIAVLLFLISGNVFSLIYAKLMGYVVRGTEDSGLMFYQVAQTVREAGQIPFSTMANRISGSSLGVIIALLGYIALVWKHKSFILALPLIGIGIFSLLGGLRFTVYAVPVAAISAVYLFHLLTQSIQIDKLRLGALALLSALFLYPNITHIIAYKVPTVFNSQEVKVLDTLKKIGSDKDYIITWWDYGYPLWFYTNKNTLIDGGKHNHDNYIVSRILNTSSQLEAAQLSRLAVETYKENNATVADILFKDHQKDQVDVDSYLENLAKNRVDLPQKSAEIFLYLPYRMLNILPTVTLFSNIDLKTGKQKQRPFFYATQRFEDKGDFIHLGNGIALDKRKGMIKLGTQEVPLQSFYTTSIQADGSLHVKRQLVSMQGQLSLIYMSAYNHFLLVDNFYLNSLYIQMFVFEQYDHSLFEKVEMSPHAKIYKLKI